jgi:hypothetical protein
VCYGGFGWVCPWGYSGAVPEGCPWIQGLLGDSLWHLDSPSHFNRNIAMPRKGWLRWLWELASGTECGGQSLMTVPDDTAVGDYGYI